MTHHSFLDSNSNVKASSTSFPSTQHYLEQCQIVPSGFKNFLIPNTQLMKTKTSQTPTDQVVTRKGTDLLDSEEECKSEELTREGSINTSVSSTVVKNKKKVFKNGVKKQQVKKIQVDGQGNKGDNHFEQFFQYVLKFKLNLKDCYNPTPKFTEKPTKPKQTHQEKNISSFTKILTFEELKENCRKKSKIHEGYCCNGCEVQPIVGTRFHCFHEECSNDYDLCGKCATIMQHEHKLVGIEENGLQKHINGLDELMETKKKSFSKSVISGENKFKHDKPLWFSHIK